ncbi:MAG: DUF4062 domain-containing protein [Acidobacteriota bacterium]
MAIDGAPLRVFISSTVRDLRQHRASVIRLLDGPDIQVRAMERGMGARAAGAVAVVKEEIESCDVLVGIYGFRYGFIPPGDERSVTEQEYDLARAAGKRCLCYLADPQADGQLEHEDDPVAQERLAAFKKRLDLELVREHFSDREQLAGMVMRDVGRILLGSPLGWSQEDVARRWAQAQRRQGDRLFDRLGRNGRPPRALLQEWSQFIEADSWHGWLDDKLQQLTWEVGEAPEFAGLAEDLAAIPRDGSCPEISAQLRDLVDRWGERGPRRSHDTPLLAETGRRILEDLGQAASDPAWGRCTLLTAATGEGKTHFITSLLRQPAADCWLLYLDPYLELLPLAERILAGARELTGLNWRNLRELDDFLAPSGARLVVIIDGLERNLEVEPRLRREIEDATRFSSLYWLVTLLETHYEAVAESAVELPGRRGWSRFVRPQIYCRQHGCYDHAGDRYLKGPEDGGLFVSQARELPTLGCWIHLSEINRRERTGLHLIERHLEVESVEEEWTRGRADARTFRLLSRPFLAWIAVDLRQELPLANLINLRFIQFVDRFWKLRRSELEPVSPLTLDQAVAIIAKVVLESINFELPRAGLEQQLVEEGREWSEIGDRSEAKQAIEALIDGHLLSASKKDAPGFVDAQAEILSLRFAPFWNWRLARQLLRQARMGEENPKSSRVVSALSRLRQRDGGTAEGILEFLLLVLEGVEEATSDPLLGEIIARTLQAGDLPAAAVWFFGAKAEASRQRDLFRHAAKLAKREPAKREPAKREPAKREPAKRELFALCHFLVEVDASVAAPQRRLEVLRAFAPQLRRLALGDYAAYAIEGWLEEATSEEEVLRCMELLIGCETLGVAPSLAGSAVWSLSRRLAGDPERILSSTLGFLKHAYESEAAPGRDKSWPYHFWEWVIHHVCHHLAAKEGVTTYRLLERHGWFRRKGKRRFPYTVWLRMQREANFALAACYLRPRYRQDFLHLTEKLSKSESGNHREKAFYLIRHTEATGRREEVFVDREFGKALERIFLDPRLERLVRKNMKMFQVNLERFEELDEARRRRLAENRKPQGQKSRMNPATRPVRKPPDQEPPRKKHYKPREKTEPPAHESPQTKQRNPQKKKWKERSDHEPPQKKKHKPQEKKWYEDVYRGGSRKGKRR